MNRIYRLTSAFLFSWNRYSLLPTVGREIAPVFPRWKWVRAVCRRHRNQRWNCPSRFCFGC